MECGKCTLCCKLPNIPTTNSKPNEWCKYFDKNKRCTIYGNHPEECKEYLCTYAQMKYAHLDLRPDKCGIIFDKISDTLILGSVDGAIDDLSDLVKRQINEFGKEGLSVAIQQYNPYKFLGFLTKGETKENIMKMIQDKANDSS